MAYRNIFVARVSNLMLWLFSGYNDKPEIAQLKAQLSLMPTVKVTKFNIVVKCNPNYMTIKKKILRLSLFHFTAMLRRY